jgi:hypothetical protein
MNLTKGMSMKTKILSSIIVCLTGSISFAGKISSGGDGVSKGNTVYECKSGAVVAQFSELDGNRPSIRLTINGEIKYSTFLCEHGKYMDELSVRCTLYNNNVPVLYATIFSPGGTQLSAMVAAGSVSSFKDSQAFACVEKTKRLYGND